MLHRSLLLAAFSLVVSVVCCTAQVGTDCVDLNSDKQPPFEDKAAVARWIVHQAYYGTLSSISLHLNGAPFGNVASFSDGTKDNSTGIIYMKKSLLDTSMKDLAVDPRCSVTVSLEQLQQGYCTTENFDVEDPRCSRLNINGKISKVDDPVEKKYAEDGLYEKHPWLKKMKSKSHHFGIYKVEMDEVWLIDFFGGATRLQRNEYEAVKQCVGDQTPSDNSSMDVETNVNLMQQSAPSVVKVDVPSQEHTTYLWTVCLSLVATVTMLSLALVIFVRRESAYSHTSRGYSTFPTED